MLKFSTAALVAASIALPAMAQTPAPSSRARLPLNTPATHDAAGNPASPYDRNSRLTDNGSMRASKIVGSSVYNDQDQKIGSIDDLVIGNDKSLNVVVTVGGFLGMGSKMVEIPFDRLQFGSAKGSSDTRVVMPGVTKDTLNGMPDFHYVNRG